MTFNQNPNLYSLINFKLYNQQSLSKTKRESVLLFPRKFTKVEFKQVIIGKDIKNRSTFSAEFCVLR